MHLSKSFAFAIFAEERAARHAVDSLLTRKHRDAVCTALFRSDDGDEHTSMRLQGSEFFVRFPRKLRRVREETPENVELFV